METVERFRLKDVDFNHPAIQFAMPLVSNHDGEIRAIGTSFSVAPGLAITAAHVVDDWLTHQERRYGYKNSGSGFSVEAIQWHEGAIYPWHVDGLYWSRSADIAFLVFRKPNWWGRVSHWGQHQSLGSVSHWGQA